MQIGSPTVGVRLPSGSHRVAKQGSELASQFGHEQSLHDGCFSASQSTTMRTRSNAIVSALSVLPVAVALGVWYVLDRKALLTASGRLDE